MGIWYKWNHTFCVFCWAWLLSLGTMFSRFTQVVACTIYVSCIFLWGLTRIFYLWIHHFLFIQTLLDGHVGCLHLLATINNAVFLCKFLFQHLFSVGGGVELQGHLVILCLTLHHFTFLPAMYEGSIFSTSSLTPVILVFIIGFTVSMKWLYHCGSDLHFPNANGCLLSFHVLFDHLYIFFG